MTNQQKADQVPPIEQLNRKVDAVIDHTATQLGKLESQAKATSEVLEQLSADFLDSHNGLSDQFRSLEALVNKRPAVQDRAELYKALASAQHEIKNADANIENEFLKKKYADLASCLDAVRGPLSANGIAVIQLTEDPGPGVLGIRTILAHESGQTIEDHITMAPPKLDPQGVGSCRTYMRRYSLIAMCGIAGALDDDAEATKADPNDYPRISTDEVEKIIYHADELFGEKADDMVSYMLKKIFTGAAAVGDIPEGQKDVALTYLENAKKLQAKRIEKALADEKAAAKAAKEEK
jgi:hypothetical protein